ncbi:YARHG domain-containing protein [Ancylomarina salipaludis]|uniref:YARHG domain-containing protein n=1 Tax=Ancylomarina salipaludis TaxID=2501299 RepID=A0A4V1MZX2_9BACT|nr:YARHG domain-containing protein [Ancylomarina salipaludis]RXQ91009.1 YARHG domain-containing protein [Ancylomarina salipaludis]
MKKLIYIYLILLSSLSVLAQDTSIFKALEELKIGSNLPAEIAEKYFGAKPDYYGEVQPIELEYYKKYDDTSLIILKYYTGVGAYSLLKFINESRSRENEEYVIMQNSDHDGSYAIAKDTDYIFINDSIIELIDTKEIVKDSSKYDSKTNWIKGDNSFWDLETVTFDSYRYIKIDSNCVVSTFSPNREISESRMYKQVSERILSHKDLNELSKEELRIMRNEIFADYGYIFNSNDLKNYFNSKSWYTPKYKTVSSKLSMVEKINIKTILRLESKNSP